MIETKKYEEILSARAETNMSVGQILQNRYNDTLWRVTGIDMREFTANITMVEVVPSERKIMLDDKDYQILINNKESI